jgi:DNA-binding CsgD family transcriptional regulator
MNSNYVIDSDAPAKVKKAFEKFFKQLTPSHSLTSRQFSIFTLMREIIDPEINALVIAPTMSDLLPGIETFSVSGMWTESRPLDLDGIHEIQTWLNAIKQLSSTGNQLADECDIQINLLKSTQSTARWDSFILLKSLKQFLYLLVEELQKTRQLTKQSQASFKASIEPHIFHIQDLIDSYKPIKKQNNLEANICEYDRRIVCSGTWKNYLQQATRHLLSIGIHSPRIRKLIGTLETLYIFISYCNELKPKRIRTPKGRHNLQASGIKTYCGNAIDSYSSEPEFKYCSLCWRPTVFTINALITRLNLKDGQISSLPKIVGSRNYCQIHDPADLSSCYRKDLKRKDDFLNEVEAIYKRKKSNFRIALKPITYLEDDARRLAYGLVHSRFKGNKENVFFLLRQGIKQAEIARRLGISRQAVSKLKASIPKETNMLIQVMERTDIDPLLSDFIKP